VLAWYGVGHLFAQLIASSSRYSAIYSSLAAAVLFIIWVNVGWLIILVGAHIARFWQYPHLLKLGGSGPDSGRVQDEALALHVMVLIGGAYFFDEPKWTLDRLAARGCCGSPDQIDALLQLLKERQLILGTNGEPEAYVPARSIENIAVRDIIVAVRLNRRKSGRPRSVQEVIDRIDGAVAGSLEGETLRDLVLAERSGAARDQELDSCAVRSDAGPTIEGMNR
jgi:membrane protein